MRLSREAVVDGGMALVDAEGLDALTIRRLAQDLGVTPMALYWHFKNKDELLAGLADRLWSFVDSDVDPDQSWQDQLRVLMGSLVEALRAHPWVTPLCMMGVEKAENGFRTVEASLAVLARGGFTPGQASDICGHALRVAIGLVGGERTEEAEETRRRRIAFETLPRDRYPHIVAAAGPMSSCDDPDGYYQFGLELFLAGVYALAPK
jgi:AcrR family transcriptional regulator